MRFQVPQFIEVEDKIFGPLTFKQFIYLGGGIGISAVLFITLPKFLALLISVPIVIFAAALAFYKINEKPFIDIVEAFVKYLFGSKLYIWKREEKKAVPKTTAERQKAATELYVPKLSQSKLKDLTWQLDIKENQSSNRGDDRRI
jgi:hypothetical protein